MANSRAELHYFAIIALFALSTGVSGWSIRPAAAQGAASGAGTGAGTGAIVLDAASSEVDYRSNTVLFRDLVITQDKTRVVADRARSTGLDFEDAIWNLSGAVSITVEGGELRSSEASVTFRNNRIARASIRGEQAQFEQTLKDGGLARGRASGIDYDLSSATVTLRGGAWLTDGRNEIRGEQLVYDLREQRVRAGESVGTTDRVRIIIRPRDTVTPEAPR
jgi:lipopolysaccharide transport protein LptA